MKLYRWESKYLKAYSVGDIIAMGETVEQAREIARTGFEPHYYEQHCWMYESIADSIKDEDDQDALNESRGLERQQVEFGLVQHGVSRAAVEEDISVREVDADDETTFGGEAEALRREMHVRARIDRDALAVRDFTPCVRCRLST